MRNLLIILSMLMFLAAGTVPAAAAVARSITPQDAVQLIRQRQDVFLLDVRTPGEFREAHLDGAHLIPIDEVTRRLAEIPKDRPILVYCAVGSRSAQVFSYLTRRGYPEVYNLDGGIYSWAAQGYSVRK